MYDTRVKFTDMEDWINQARQAEADAFTDFGLTVSFEYHGGETWVYLYGGSQGPRKFDSLDDAVRYVWSELED